jgi:hypothetical protein
MRAGTTIAAAGWFLLLAAGALCLDGADRYRRFTTVRNDLAGAERDAAARRARAREHALPAAPLPVDDSVALQPVPGLRSHVTFDPAVRGRVFDPSDGVSDDGGRTWRPLSQEERESRDVATRWHAALLPNGQVLVNGEAIDAPGRVAQVTGDINGTAYVAIRDPGRFPLWFTRSAHDPWQPIGGSGPVVAIAAGEPGTLYVAGQRLGSWREGQWTWTDWPDQFAATTLIAHPRAPLVVASGPGQVAISRDGGRTLRKVRLLERRITWLGIDPLETGRVLVSLDEGGVFVLDLERLP